MPIACRPATPAPMTKTRAGVIVPAAVISRGKNLGRWLRRDQDRLVARDRAHGAEGVHRLGARDARHQLHGERRDPARRPGPGCPRRSRRAGAGRSASRPRLIRRDFLGGRRLDLEEHVGPGEHVRLEACALLRVGGVREAGRRARPGLDDDLQAGPAQASATSSGTSATRRSPGTVLFRNADDHEILPVRRALRRAATRPEQVLGGVCTEATSLGLPRSTTPRRHPPARHPGLPDRDRIRFSEGAVP